MTKPQAKGAPLFGDVEAPIKVGDKVSGIKKGKTGKIVAVAIGSRPAEIAPMNMLAVIARAAADPNVVPEKMRALLDMQKEIAGEEARIAFTEAFIQLQDELPTINAQGRIVIEGKAGKKGQNTAYAKFNEINRVVKPLLKKHGFTLSFATEPSPDGTRIIVKGFLDHVRGHQRVTAFPLPAEPSGSKNNVQAWGSSYTYGKRYAAVALLNIVSEAKEDDDKDGATGDVEEKGPITAAQAKALVALVDSSGVGGVRFCEKYGIEKVADLPAHRLDEATTALKNFSANNKKG